MSLRYLFYNNFFLFHFVIICITIDILSPVIGRLIIKIVFISDIDFFFKKIYNIYKKE